MNSVEKKVPVAAGFIKWLREPKNKTWRFIFGGLLILGGLFSILPGLGIWMLPLGLVLLAIDIYTLRGPITSTIIKARKAWQNWRRKKKAL